MTMTKFWRGLRAVFAWRQHHASFAWSYQENQITGERRAMRIRSGVYQPVDFAWLEGRAEREPSIPSDIVYPRNQPRDRPPPPLPSLPVKKA